MQESGRISETPESGRVQVASQWDDYAEQLRQKLPPAPAGLLNGYVRWMPWVAIVLGGLWALLMLAALLLTSVIAPLLVFGGASGIASGGAAFFAAIIGLASAVLEVAGGVLMLRMRLTGWWLLALGLIVSAVSSLLSLSLFGLLIMLLVAYVHVQVKPRYS